MYFEKVNDYEHIDIIDKNIYFFFLIEVAKQGKVILIGNGKQGIVWLANYAINSYKKYWYYLDIAFKHYNFYKKIQLFDKKGTFKRHKEKLENVKLDKNEDIEKVIWTLFPELKIKSRVGKGEFHP